MQTCCMLGLSRPEANSPGCNDKHQDVHNLRVFVSNNWTIVQTADKLLVSFYRMFVRAFADLNASDVVISGLLFSKF